MEKIVFADGTEFEAAAYPADTEPSLFEKKRTSAGAYRETLRLTLSGAYADINAKFTDGAAFAVRQFEPDGNGGSLETYTDFDKSEFSVAGDIVDHRNGTFSVYMGKKTEAELAIEALRAQLSAQ